MPGEHDESLRERPSKIDCRKIGVVFSTLIKDTEECEYYTMNRQIKNSYVHFFLLVSLIDCFMFC